ncbi:MAG: hypothetical protein EA383_15020 [Spirochaetaceae bacterium]|nr:MAG: hypothetical protein EA383_15020 [Spirochaetaceae bacterium]
MSAGSYFVNLHQTTQNRFWINNPDATEIENALNHDAYACTTNPAYCAKLLQSEPDYLTDTVDEVLDLCPDAEQAARLVYQRVSQRLMEAFLPKFLSSEGTAGFVTMQPDPRIDEDAEKIIADIEANRSLGPNYMAKIPVIESAIAAMDYCFEEGIPICATEVFSIAQAVYVYRRYQRVAARSKIRAPLYVTHITGIFDEYLAKTVDREGLQIRPASLHWAGLAVAHKQLRVQQDLCPEAIMLGGGARGPHHFTGLVPSTAHITINWSTAEELLGSEVSATHEPITVDERDVEELRAKVPTFRRAYDDDGLVPGEFARFGPTQLFRSAFLKGWYTLLAAVADRKQCLAR